MGERFHTDYQYRDRQTKAKYVWLKYKEILKGKILDVGADQCYLKKYLGEFAQYLGIGLGEGVDKQVDLEAGPLPFEDSSFDCVLCLDVLEHVDNMHYVFDELCRVTSRYVVVSLPNPWADFYGMLRRGYYQENRPAKFYYLPPEPPEDRHKWFFSTEEAEKFISYRAAKNGMRILQMDIQGIGNEGGGFRGLLRKLAVRFLFSDAVNLRNLYTGPLWAVLENSG